MPEDEAVFEAWIELEGEKLQEFDYPFLTPLSQKYTSEVDTVSCWIASEAGKVSSLSEMTETLLTRYFLGLVVNSNFR